MMRKPNNHRRAVAAVVAVALLASPGCGSDAEPFVDALDTSGQDELDALVEEGLRLGWAQLRHRGA